MLRVNGSTRCAVRTLLHTSTAAVRTSNLALIPCLSSQSVLNGILTTLLGIVGADSTRAAIGIVGISARLALFAPCRRQGARAFGELQSTKTTGILEVERQNLHSLMKMRYSSPIEGRLC